MKYFQSVLKHLTILGIDATQRPLNQKIIMIFLLYALNSTLIVVFLVNETISFREYIDAIYMTAASIAINIHFTFVAIKMEKLFAFFGTMQEIIENSESTF